MKAKEDIHAELAAEVIAELLDPNGKPLKRMLVDSVSRLPATPRTIEVVYNGWLIRLDVVDATKV